MPRVLQVNKAYFPHIGGVETIVQQVAEGLNGRDGFEVEVLACGSSLRGASESVRGVRIERAGTLGRMLSMPLSFELFPRFRRMADRVDAIVLHHPFPLGFMAARLLTRNKPIIVWYHSDIVRQRISNAMLGPLWNGMLDQARGIFVSSRRLLTSSAILRRFVSKCTVVPFGIDSRRFDPTPEVIRATAAIRSRYGGPLLLSVGRLVYYKGFEFLIDAMRTVGAKLILVGSGPLESPLVKLIHANGVADRVHIIPSVDDLTPYYHACDVFVLPSVAASEAFGLVQMEAMACGKPVVNTRLPTAVPEVSTHNKTGLTVTPADSAALAEAIGQLLGDNSLRARLGHNARERVVTEFSVDRFLDDVERGISRVLLREERVPSRSDATDPGADRHRSRESEDLFARTPLR